MNIAVNAQKRDIGKRSDLNKLRIDGQVPAIIYGNGQKGIKISINARDFTKSYKKSIGEIAFFDITVGDHTYKTFLKEKQVHPLTRKIQHLDFLELHKGKEITILVPINYVGEAPGTKEGGVLEIIHRTLQITCFPKDIPEEIKVDVSSLNIGDAIHFGDISLSKEIETELTAETTLVAVSLPTIMEEPEEEEEGVEGLEGEEISEEETDEEKSESEDSEKDSA
ncbi:MAG: 50S ribosomal protein L25 [Candidatus Cloacimonetes bacterium]|nr:50S ribosomal protein L25 [Candidatus Cloacimonadota bacterium]